MRPWLYSDYLTSPVSSDSSSGRELESWPVAVRELLEEIRTIEALDALCAIVREPFRKWRIDELPGTVGLDQRPMDEAVSNLVNRGLIRRHDDGSIQSALTGARTAAMHALCRLCDEDRPNVLGAIAQLSIDRVRVAAARTLVGHARPDTGEP